jgi:hypothetical protein
MLLPLVARMVSGLLFENPQNCNQMTHGTGQVSNIITATDCIFEDISRNGQNVNGGAILAGSSTSVFAGLRVTNCRFIRCKVSGTGSPAPSGGGIAAWVKTYTVEDTTGTGCTAVAFGAFCALGASKNMPANLSQVSASFGTAQQGTMSLYTQGQTPRFAVQELNTTYNRCQEANAFYVESHDTLLFSFCFLHSNWAASLIQSDTTAATQPGRFSCISMVNNSIGSASGLILFRQTWWFEHCLFVNNGTPLFSRVSGIVHVFLCAFYPAAQTGNQYIITVIPSIMPTGETLRLACPWPSPSRTSSIRRSTTPFKPSKTFSGTALPQTEGPARSPAFSPTGSLTPSPVWHSSPAIRTSIPLLRSAPPETAAGGSTARFLASVLPVSAGNLQSAPLRPTDPPFHDSLGPLSSRPWNASASRRTADLLLTRLIRPSIDFELASKRFGRSLPHNSADAFNASGPRRQSQHPPPTAVFLSSCPSAESALFTASASFHKSGMFKATPHWDTSVRFNESLPLRVSRGFPASATLNASVAFTETREFSSSRGANESGPYVASERVLPTAALSGSGGARATGRIKRSAAVAATAGRPLTRLRNSPVPESARLTATGQFTASVRILRTAPLWTDIFVESVPVEAPAQVGKTAASLSWLLWVLVAAAVLIVCGIVGLCIAKRRKKSTEIQDDQTQDVGVDNEEGEMESHEYWNPIQLETQQEDTFGGEGRAVTFDGMYSDLSDNMFGDRTAVVLSDGDGPVGSGVMEGMPPAPLSQ